MEEAETSGVAVVEVHLPSGYYVMQDYLIDLVNSRTVRNLRWALRTDTQVKFFFNHVSLSAFVELTDSHFHFLSFLISPCLLDSLFCIAVILEVT